jgi:outer membrane protein assembly factor BamB
VRSFLLVALVVGPGASPPCGWRGDGSGRFPATAPPLEWSASKNVRWTCEVGVGYASPVVAGDLVVVASEPDLLIAVGRADGRERWRLRTGPSDLPDEAARSAAAEYKAKDTGLAAATPAFDGRAIYAVFANGIVRSVDPAGRPRWIAHIGAPQSTAYGRSASPILAGGRLVVHMTHLYAFDPATGRQVWVNEEARCGYGTPAALSSGGLDLVVTPGGDVVRADDGKGVNRQIGNAANSSPVAADGRVYFAERDVRAIRLGSDFKDESVWNSEMRGEVFGSPVLHEGLLFAASAKGELYVFDAKATGEKEPLTAARPLFDRERMRSGNTVYSSLALAGRHLYLASNHGETVVLEATAEAKEVARNLLPDGTGSSPVFAGPDLFLRDGARLYCLRGR